jgi:hypothetical protein
MQTSPPLMSATQKRTNPLTTTQTKTRNATPMLQATMCIAGKTTKLLMVAYLKGNLTLVQIKKRMRLTLIHYNQLKCHAHKI